MELTTATGLFTSNVAGAELPPPGVGFDTVIWLAELSVRSAAGIVIPRLVAELLVVAIAVPFHCTVELEMNPVPVMTTGVAAEPATVNDGAIEVIVGIGFGVGGGLGGAAIPPPQPLIIRRQERTNAEATHVPCFINNSRL
jgi:hypothetical protein